MKKLKVDELDETSCKSCDIAGISPICFDESLSLLGERKTDLFIPTKVPVWDNVLDQEKIYILRGGVVKLLTVLHDKASLEILYPGAFFGGISLSEHPNVRLKAVAAANAKICMIDKSMIEELAKTTPKFIRAYMTYMALYISDLHRMSHDQSNVSLQQRLCEALLKDFKKRGYQYNGQLNVTKIMSHEEWALYLRARRESISRQFSSLEKAQIIKVNPDSITLLNEPELLKIISDANKK